MNIYFFIEKIIIIFGITLLSCCNFSKAQQTSNSDSLVKPGVNSITDYLPLLEGRTVGIVANHASLIGKTHLVDSLLTLNSKLKQQFRIQAIFTPEHGFSGKYDAGKHIENEENSLSDIQIISLYGSNRKPSVEDLKGIDVILFDLQDVGVRFYTYISTLHYVMEACAENNIPMVVLDRPNPHCNYVDGPVLKPEFQSFVGMHAVPVVYGMTIGEYAQMINGEGWLEDNLKCELEVIRIRNFARDSNYAFPSKPSPNLPNMRAIHLYPSLCFFEGTVLSVGRGTEFPFQVYGHPDYSIKEFNFTPVSTPGASINPKLENEICYGKDLRDILISDLQKCDSLNIKFLLDSYADLELNELFFNNYFDILAGTEKLRLAIIAGESEDEIRNGWKPDIDTFLNTRSKYLLYK